VIFWKNGALIAYNRAREIYDTGRNRRVAGWMRRPTPVAPYERPLAKTEFQTVRTTAYTDTEADHIPYGNHNALGTTLNYGTVKSAAADWSRWPAGTIFRIVQTGETYQVDDYGWDLAGRNTIDLYKPSRYEMNCWGCRNVTIQILQWAIQLQLPCPGTAQSLSSCEAHAAGTRRQAGLAREFHTQDKTPHLVASASQKCFLDNEIFRLSLVYGQPIQQAAHGLVHFVKFFVRPLHLSGCLNVFP